MGSRRKVRRPPRRRDKARNKEGTLRIGVLTCLWRRHALSNLVLGHYARMARQLAPTIQLELFAAGSEGRASRELAERHGVHYVEHPNQPLGAKWNAGLRFMRGAGLDAVLIVGSDDLIDLPVVERYAKELRAGARFIGLEDMYFMHQPTARLLYWPGYQGPRAGETIGLARCIHREYLDAVDWHLWRAQLSRGLDRSMMEILAPLLMDPARRDLHKVLNARANDFAPLDVKTATNVWSFDDVAGTGDFEYLDADTFLRRYFDHEFVSLLQRLPVEAAEVVGGTTQDRVERFLGLREEDRQARPVSAPQASLGRDSATEGNRQQAQAATLAPADELVAAGEAAFAAGDLAAAETLFRKALHVAPIHSTALNDLAVVLHAQTRTAEAEVMFLRAAVLYPQADGPLINLAAIARQEGRDSEADAYLRRFDEARHRDDDDARGVVESE